MRCFEQNFHSIHTGFHGDLSKALGIGRDGAGGGATVADCFVTWKEKFLLYGEFCSNLPKAQELLDRLCNGDQLIQQKVLVSANGPAIDIISINQSIFIASRFRVCYRSSELRGFRNCFELDTTI